MGRIALTLNMVKSENSNKSKVYIFLNMAYNIIRYQINFVDYRKSNFINLKKEDKRKCLGMKEYRKVLNYLDDKGYTSIFLDKIVFNKIFKNYIGREFIDLRVSSISEFETFIKDKKTFFAKKHNSCGGDGIERIINKNLDIPKLYKQLIDKKQFLVEETIIQHPYLTSINSKAVNNIRIVTLLNNGEVIILCKCLRLSDGIEEVISCHDIMCSLDDEGNMISKAYDDYFVNFPKHPTTGFDFNGGKIPFMKEIIEMAKKAALEVPEVRYVGWDFAVSEKGPLIIEGNFFPSVGLHQYYLINNDYFLKEQLQKNLGDEYKKIS